MSELRYIEMIERIRAWVLHHRPGTEKELIRMMEVPSRRSLEVLRLEVLGAFLDVQIDAAQVRRQLRQLVRSIEPEASEILNSRVAETLPETPGVQTLPGLPSEGKSVRGVPSTLSRTKCSQIRRLWEWVEKNRPPTLSDDPGTDRASRNSGGSSSGDPITPEQRLNSMMSELPFLGGLTPYRILQTLGSDGSTPDHSRQRLLFRLGILDRPPDASPEQRKSVFVKMAALGRASGDPVRVLDHLFGVFSGAIPGLGANFDGDGSCCRSRPDCPQCPVKDLCLGYRMGVGTKKREGNRAIKYWTLEERPRERLMLQGAEALADSELLAIVLRSGTEGRSAVELARLVLQTFHSLDRIDQASTSELESVPGIGPAKAAEIKAALELGKRVKQAPLTPGNRMTCSRDVYEAMAPRVAGQKREAFLLLAFNAKNEILKTITVSIGNLTQSLVHPREVFREAIREAAAAVMLIHNHPSGDPTPSHDDERITERLCKAGNLLGIRVLDHIVIGHGRYFSFADEGQLPDGM